MKKCYAVVGKFKNVTGEIVVTMNYSSKIIKGTHSGTHDDYTKTIPLHKIEVFVNGKLWIDLFNIELESALLRDLERQESSLLSHLDFIANTEPAKTFIDKLKDKGYE